MAEASINPLPALGIGEIISGAFALIKKNFLSLFLISLVLALISTAGLFAISSAFGDESSLGNIVDLLISAVFSGALLKFLYHRQQFGEGSFFEALSAAVKNGAYIIVLSVVVGLLFILGAIALIIPGLYIYAIFYLIMPAIMIEGRGFGAMQRSRELTKGFRWPIVGLFILMGILTLLIWVGAAYLLLLMPFQILAGVSSESFGLLDVIFGLVSSPLWMAYFTFMASLVGTLLSAFGNAAILLTYLRLKLIKDGFSGEVDEVFS